METTIFLPRFRKEEKKIKEKGKTFFCFLKGSKFVNEMQTSRVFAFLEISLPFNDFPHTKLPTSFLTLMHMQSENGRVATMRRMETRARRRAQQPGPSGSAGKEK